MLSTVPQPLVRPFRISYAAMLQETRTIQDLLAEDIAAFTDLAPEIDDEFLTIWRADYDAAVAIQSDESFVDEIAETTQEVQAAMAEARRVYIRTKFAVVRAWPGNAARANQFGFDDYKNIRKSDKLMFHFMDELHKQAVKNTAALNAVNFLAADIASIRTAADAIAAADSEQENLKKDRLLLTQQRTELLIIVWTKRQLVAAAAKVLYMDNYAKYQQYLLPPSESSPEDFAIMGMVQDAAGNGPIEYAEVRIDSLDLTVLTDETGTYGIADNIPPGTYTLTFSKEGYVTFETEIIVTSADETLTVNANLNANPAT